MPHRKMIVTSKRPSGTGPNLSTLVRLELVEDPADIEATAMNADVLSFTITARLSPTTDVSAWSVGQTRTIDIDL